MIITRIRNKDLIYDSVVFAVSYKTRKSKIVVFDEKYTKLIVLEYSWHSDIDVMFLNYDSGNYKINNENYKVYWNDNKFFEMVKKQKYSFEVLEEAKKIQGIINYKEWIKVKNEFELKGLIFTTGEFHDANVIKISKHDDYAEILIDTTWGFYVMLKCHDVIENALDLNYYFFDCDYSFNDGIIEIDFNDEFNGLKKLKCKKLEYKYFYEKKCKVKKYKIEDNYIVFNDNQIDELRINLLEVNKNIFSCDNVVNVGMKKYFDNFFSYTFVLDDFFVVAIFHKKMESEEKFKNRVTKIDELLLEKDYNLYSVFEDDIIVNERERFGNIVFQEEYVVRGFFHILKYASIPLGGNILFWLIIQLCNPEMKWLIFWIFGVGISLVVFLIYLSVYCLNYQIYKDKLTLYENGLVCIGNSLSCSIAYSAITDIELHKRIVVTTEFKKFKLLKSKNNKKIYEIIKQRVSEINK